MAESKTPKHDFAPAWLKLPGQEQTSKISKPSNNHYSGDKIVSPRSTNKPDSGDSKRSFRNRRDSGNYRSHDRYDTLQRQHSFDNYPDGGRYGSKLRHHSVDDYYSCPYSYNNYPEGQYGSQPSLQRQSKYHHPNARYNKQQMMGMYPSYYDMYPYDFYSGEPYYGYPSRSKRNTYPDKDPRPSTRDKKPGSNGEQIEANFNEEFPSLNGHDGDTNTNKVTSGGSVWDKLPKKKVGNSNSVSSGDLAKDSPSKVSGSYKVLIPNNKNVLPKKGSLRINGTHSNQDHGLISRVPKVNGVGPTSATQPMEIFSPRLLTHTRSKGDKSEFLKTLRNASTFTDSDSAIENKQSRSPESDELSEDVVDGVESLKVDNANENMLSSSVEAEQRLLREMGWSEFDDGEEYVITEADMKEFQSLSQQVRQQPTNGLVRTLPKAWNSPSHLGGPRSSPCDLKDDLSSSSDSDDSC